MRPLSHRRRYLISRVLVIAAASDRGLSSSLWTTIVWLVMGKTQHELDFELLTRRPRDQFSSERWSAHTQRAVVRALRFFFVSVVLFVSFVIYKITFTPFSHHISTGTFIRNRFNLVLLIFFSLTVWFCVLSYELFVHCFMFCSPRLVRISPIAVLFHLSTFSVFFS